MEIRKKEELFQRIVEVGFFAQLEQENLFLDFINSFKDLKSMKSTDGRPQFKNAEDDIRQHFILNPEDMTLEEVFSSKVGIYQDEETFTGFLLAIVDSRFTRDKDFTERLASIINSYLHQDNQELYLYGYGSNGRPVYRIKDVEDEYSPRGVEANKIPIFIDKNDLRTSAADEQSRHGINYWRAILKLAICDDDCFFAWVKSKAV